MCDGCNRVLRHNWAPFYKGAFYASVFFCVYYTANSQMDKALVEAVLCVAFSIAGWMPREEK